MEWHGVRYHTYLHSMHNKKLPNILINRTRASIHQTLSHPWALNEYNLNRKCKQSYYDKSPIAIDLAIVHAHYPSLTLSHSPEIYYSCWLTRDVSVEFLWKQGSWVWQETKRRSTAIVPTTAFKKLTREDSQAQRPQPHDSFDCWSIVIIENI